MTATRDWRFWALVGLFVLLVGLQLAAPRLDSDQAVTGLMGLHILRGEFPIFFWGQRHAGIPESYGAAVFFFLLGVSRWTLNLVPSLAAVGLALAAYRTGAVLFGHGAGLLAILFVTIVSPYVASHYVLARAYYIEHLLAGQVLLLGAALWLARPLSEAAKSRTLVAMGLAGGVGLYFGFQIVDALVPAAFALLLVDPGFVLRRGAWLGLGAFFLGSAPFWIHNASHGWGSFATGLRFQRDESLMEALDSIFSNRLPVLLGVREWVRTPPYLPGPLAFTAPAIVVAALGLLAVRVGRGIQRLRQDPALAGEAMLLVAAATAVGVVWVGRFTWVPRYLLPLMPILALVLARASQLVWRRSRIAAIAGAAAYVAAVGVGYFGDLAVLWPSSWQTYWTRRGEDMALFAFLQSQGLRHAYAYEYWLAPRLTFDAAEAVIVADPVNDRYPPYTRAVDASPRPAYIVRRGDLALFENWLRASGIRAQRVQLGPYFVLSDFVPPAKAVPVPRAGWRVTTSPGTGEPGALVDGRLTSGWSSAPGPARSAWVEVDLGQPRRVAGVTILTDDPTRIPGFLEVAAGDGPPFARLDTHGFTVTWRNGAPRTAPGPALTVRFAPIETRHLRLTSAGDTPGWPVTELFVLAPASDPRRVAGTPSPLEMARRLEAAGAREAALLRYRVAMEAQPDDPEGYIGFLRLAADLGLDRASPAARAARFLGLGLADEARAAYDALIRTLPPDVSHAELARAMAIMAARLGETERARRLEADADAIAYPRGRVHTAFGRRLELTGCDPPPDRVRPRQTLELACGWRLSPDGAPLVTSVQVRGPHGAFGGERALPGWIPGLGTGPQHLVGRWRLVVPDDARPGRHRILVGVRQPSSGHMLRGWWAGILPLPGHRIELGTVEVLPAAAAGG